ncbi:linalool dehydratase/isomerase domain-containing protein [Rhodococcus triatomae]
MNSPEWTSRKVNRRTMIGGFSAVAAGALATHVVASPRAYGIPSDGWGFGSSGSSGGAGTPSWDALGAIDVNSYPSFGREELGMLEYQFRKATAREGDWSLWEASVGFDGRNGVTDAEADGLQYDLHHSASAVAIAADKTPAYRDFAETVLGGILAKGLDDRAWRYWTENANHSHNDGSHAPYHADPAVSGNAMYMGNIMSVASKYALMTNSLSKSHQFEFVYRGDGVEIAGTKVAPGQSWTHGWDEIMQTFVQQIQADSGRMLLCQIPTRYLVCNVSVAQSILGFDHVHGTNYAAQTVVGPDKMLEKIGEDWFVPARSSGQPLDKIYLVYKGVHTDGGLQWFPGWAPAPFDQFSTWNLHQISHQFSTEAYEMTKRKFLSQLTDGTAYQCAPDGSEDRNPFVAPVVGSGTTTAGQTLDFTMADIVSTVHGAHAAAVLGDTAMAGQMLDWNRNHSGPLWDGDMLVHKFGDERPDYYLRNGYLQSMVLAAAAARPGVLRESKVDRSRFVEPTLTGLAWPEVKVRAATFDAGRSALVVQTTAKRDSRGTVVNLRPGSTVRLLIDGNQAGESKADNQGQFSFSVPAGDHSFTIGVA